MSSIWGNQRITLKKLVYSMFLIEPAIFHLTCFFYFDWRSLLVFQIESVSEKTWVMFWKVHTYTIWYTNTYLACQRHYREQFRKQPLGYSGTLPRVSSSCLWVWHWTTLPGPSVFSDSTCHAREAVTRCWVVFVGRCGGENSVKAGHLGLGIGLDVLSDVSCSLLNGLSS